MNDAITDKALAIMAGVYDEQDGTPEDKTEKAAREMAFALAMLTSQVKAEREDGKALIRRWRHHLGKP